MPAASDELKTAWVSVDALTGCDVVARDAGFDIKPYLARHGIDPALIDSAQGLIAFAAMSDCLEDVAKSENCPDFGFRLAKAQRPLQFGLLSQVLVFAPTVGEAIRMFLKYRDLYSQPSHWDLHLENGFAYLRRYGVQAMDTKNPQVLTYAMTKGFEAFKSLLDQDWRPVGVYFSCDPVNVSPAMRRHFGSPLFFHSQYDEIVFLESDLARSIPTGNAGLLAALLGYFDRLLPDSVRRGPASAQVQKILRAQFGSEPCSLGAVARIFSMHPRTLQRMLANEGTSFRTLEREWRMQIAGQLVETTRMPLSDVAAMAGYHHLSSFSRAYTRTSGLSARKKRRQGNSAV